MYKRKELEILYKIIAYLKLDDNTYKHLSTRSSSKESYFILPFGLRFEEITEDNLIEIGLDGKVHSKDDAKYNKTGYVIHGQIYKNREDVNSIIHVHSPEIVAVSSIKEGLMPISQWALHFYNKISYHEYNSLILDVDNQDLIKDLGQNNILMLRNHGIIICGKTIHEALFYLYHMQIACKTQILTLSQNRELVIPSVFIAEKSVQDLLSFEQDLGKRDWDAWVRLLERKN